MTQTDTIVWLTVADVATRLNLSKMTVYRMIQEKEIPAHKFGRAYRIKEADYDKFVADSKIS